MKLNLSNVIGGALGCAFALAFPVVYAGNVSTDKTVIQTQSELPTFSYKITTPTASALLDDDAALLALAEAQRKDAESTLAKYEIADKATLRDLYGAIRDAALIRGDAKTTLEFSAKVRDLADKPTEKLTSGLRVDAAAAAMAAGDDQQAREAAFRKALAASIDLLPWAVVGDDVIAWKGQFDTPNMGTLMRGNVQGRLDSVVKQSGELGWDAARQVINVAIYARRIEPYLAQASLVLGEYIAAHRQIKTDIWHDREFTLDSSKGQLTPTVVAVWDQGVDTALFTGRLFVNPAEVANGKDDDGNGFVDDIHGIGFDEDYNPAIESLMPFEARYPGREAELRELTAGRGDMDDGIDSPALQALRQRIASLKPEEVPLLMEAGLFYFHYMHGTLVAGVAMDSNPAARLMVIRANSNGYLNKPPAPTLESAKRMAGSFKQIVDYMKANGVRVVNMSWIATLGDLEKDLEVNDIGATPDERRTMALEMFNVVNNALTQALREAPQILFVPAAGNSDSDVGFARAFPADIDLPNVLTVGAVDQAGDQAYFTSFGERVRVYSNGFQVESVVPGGSHMRGSGTSMAAPQVTNLAAKLFTLDPKLTPTEVIELILNGATKSTDGKRLLINPKASVALLEAKH